MKIGCFISIYIPFAWIQLKAAYPKKTAFSSLLFLTQYARRMHFGRFSGGKQNDKKHESKDCDWSNRVSNRVKGRDAEEQAAHQFAKERRETQPKKNSDDNKRKRLSEQGQEHMLLLRAQSQTDANVPYARRH